MAYFASMDGDDESFDKMREILSPAQVDHSVRQALQMCWMMLPKDKRNADELGYRGTIQSTRNKADQSKNTSGPT